MIIRLGILVLLSASFTRLFATEPRGGIIRNLVFFEESINDSLRYHPYSCSGPTIVKSPRSGKYSLQFAAGSRYAGVQIFWAGNTVPTDWWGPDTAVFWAQRNSVLSFWVKSNSAGHAIGVNAYGFNNLYGGVDSVSIRTADKWQKVEMPIPEALCNLPLKGFELNFGDAQPTILFDDFKITNVRMYAGAGSPPPLSLTYIAASQIGYAPQMKKQFTSPVNFKSFTVVRTSDSKVVFNGSASLRSVKSNVIGNAEAFIGDFSQLTTPGRYRIVVEERSSLPFTIGRDVFDGPIRAAQRFFCYQRAFTAVEMPYAEGPWVHPSDAEKAPPGVKKGWHDAGDLTLYMPTTTQAIWWLLESWMDFRPASDSTNIPESGNGVPDILDEVRWGLEWVLSMQDQNGGFWGNACAGGTNTYPYGLTTPNTVGNYVKTVSPTAQNTAKAVAVLAYASKVFLRFDAKFAATCSAAAQTGWSWIVQNPNQTTDADGGACGVYAQGADETLLQTNKLWAAAALLYATGHAAYESAFQSLYVPPYWISSYSKSDAFAAKMYLRCRENANAETQAAIRRQIFAMADGVRADADAHPFQWATHYYWGSMSNAAHRTGQFSWAAFMLDSARTADRDQLLDNVHYLFGRNALNFCYMSGADAWGATQWRKEGFHQWMKALHATPFHFPGAVAGGPNEAPASNDISYPDNRPYPTYGYFGDPRYPRNGTTPIDARYTDNDSWCTNEIVISWQGAILYNLFAAQAVAEGRLSALVSE